MPKYRRFMMVKMFQTTEADSMDAADAWFDSESWNQVDYEIEESKTERFDETAQEWFGDDNCEDEDDEGDYQEPAPAAAGAKE